ncbi:hypothetical protein TeGR_g2711 [Tetraparma gracilis]|uniref:Elongation factor G, mitochondrial n=1 Tax=Tetraparma gracilis TaxID=2962635 RepID=A0ABQ6N2D4_9STRA|nr:hypothetical protein TeGR_g2711 [Tetraparma gracilis]
MCFLNKMDRTGADFYYCLKTIKEQLGSTMAVLQLPIGTEMDFQGIIDLVTMEAVYWTGEELGANYERVPVADAVNKVPFFDDELLAKAKEYRETLVELAVEQDEEALMEYLEGNEPDVATMKRCLRKGTLANAFVPIVTGTAFKNKGVQPLLDAVIDYMPSPLDVDAIKGIDEKGEETDRASSDDLPFSALAFKVANDPFVGTLTFTRVYSGVLETGTSVYNSVKGKNERIGRMLQMHANDRTEIKQARAGDIVALVGLKDTTTGETLCDKSNSVILEKMEFPTPVIKVAVEPKTKADQQKMGTALNRLAAEDPSFRYSRDEQTGQTIIEGMGELHLEIIVDRMKREFNVECNVGAPEVSYREAITKDATVDYTHKKQSGGSGQFARVKIEFSPKVASEDDDEETSDALEFINEIKGGSVPKEYIPGVQKGMESVLSQGIIAGFPVLGMTARLVDGAYHDVDSSVMAFEIAGRAACREGLRKAGVRLLEPLMAVDVITPEEYMGDIIGDITSRRGVVGELGDRSNAKTISASVPLANMFQYVSALRSMSKGRAAYSMKLSNYDFVPPNIEKELTEGFKAAEEE